ncbi:hypothetical protein GCM10027589_37950 [Actinocorallia lasiicapitis]
MSDARQGAPAGPPAPVAILTPVITGILIGVVFLLIFIPALHRPEPNGVPVGVVGVPVSQLEASGALDGFDLKTVTDPAAAEKQIKDGDIQAAFISQNGQNSLLVSSAHGAVATNTIKGVFTGVAAGTGNPQLAVRDVLPAVKGDPNGVSVFYLIFGVTLGAFLFGQGSFAVARHLPVKIKVAQTLAFSVVIGLLAALIARVWVGVLPGSIPAETGILILLGAAVGSFTLAVTSVLKDAGVAVGTIVALILGTASSGGATPTDFIPTGFAFFSHFLPPGVAVSALHDIGYFKAGDAVVPTLILLAWIIVSLGIVFLVEGRRSGPAVPAPAQESVPAA